MKQKMQSEEHWQESVIYSRLPKQSSLFLLYNSSPLLLSNVMADDNRREDNESNQSIYWSITIVTVNYKVMVSGEGTVDHGFFCDVIHPYQLMKSNHVVSNYITKSLL